MQQTLAPRKIDISPFPADMGCHIAERYLIKNSPDQLPPKCYLCPFPAIRGRCLYDVNHSTKELLKNHKVILQIFDTQDSGLQLSDICEKFSEQSPHTIKNWLYSKDNILKTFKIYEPIFPFLAYI